MKNEKKDLNKLIHIRFTEAEQRQLKAISALEGKSIQEYVHGLVLKDIEKKRVR